MKTSLILTRLLSGEDKKDMQQGNIPMETLECAVKAWMDAGMPDYAHGFTNPTVNISLNRL